jgi:Eukaryotic membrane protein family
VCVFVLLQNALEVYVCEILIDAIKHSFLAKFNEIKPVAYSEFLEDLCKQVIYFSSYCAIST